MGSLRIYLLTVVVLAICCQSANSFNKSQHPPAPADYCCPVRPKLLWSKSVRNLDSAASRLLNPLLSYRFLLPEIQLRDGLAHFGAATRLRRFVSALLTGDRPLKVGVLGGSISWGDGATARGRTDWFSIFMAWLTSVSRAPVTSRNGCVPASSSTYMLLCLDHHLDKDVDLVFVDYMMNEGVVDALTGNVVVVTMEKLLRRIFALPGRPAVVFVQMPRLRSSGVTLFPSTMEDVEGSLEGYYDVPALSLRNALFALNLHDPTDGFLWNQTYLEHRQPGDAAHRAVADLAVHLIQEAALSLVRYPLTDQEVATWDELPVPMYEDNYPPLMRSCIVGPDLPDLVIDAEGWAFVNEGGDGRPRWGYVASAPGSVLSFRVDTADPRAADGAHPPVWTVPVLLQYRKTYARMGKAIVTCHGGCTCTGPTLDGWHEQPVSQTSMALVKTHRLEDTATVCDIRVTVSNETRSGGFKFKVTGIVVGMGFPLEGIYDHKYWRIPEEEEEEGEARATKDKEQAGKS